MVGSSGGSGGIMPKLKAVPAGSQVQKREQKDKKVFEMSSRENNEQYARVGIQAKVMNSS